MEVVDPGPGLARVAVSIELCTVKPGSHSFCSVQPKQCIVQRAPVIIAQYSRHFVAYVTNCTNILRRRGLCRRIRPKPHTPAPQAS